MIRWQTEANVAKQRFSRSARNCKVGSIQSFNEAKQHLEDLATLVRGDRLAKARAAEDSDWGDFVDRLSLMQRMEKALTDDVSQQLVDAQTFAASSDQVLHSAELIAAIANVIGQPSMEDAESANYTLHSNQLMNDARMLAQAARARDHKAAADAFTALQKTVRAVTLSGGE